MATQILASDGVLSYGGAVLQLSTGTKVAVFYDDGATDGIVAYKDIDGTPTKLGSTQTDATVHGTYRPTSIAACVDSNDVVHILSVSYAINTAGRDVAYNTLSGIDGTPSWGTWELVATFVEGAPGTGQVAHIEVDSNDYPRAMWCEDYKYKGTGYQQPYYSHDVGAGWITKERVPVAENEGYTGSTGFEVKGDDSVVAVYYYGIVELVRRERNGTWGSETNPSTGGTTLAKNALGITSGGTEYVYNYNTSSLSIFENNSDTGYDVEAVGAWLKLSSAVMGTYRWVVFLNDDDDVVVAFNSGSGWDSSTEQTGTYGVVIAAKGLKNNYSDGTIGYIFIDGSGNVYYDEYSDGAAVVTASATLTGTGNLSAAAYKITTATATITGAGDLSATTLNITSTSASIAGTGDLSATLERIILGVANLSGTGDLSATGEAIVAAVANLSGSGDLSATPSLFVLASAALSGAGDLSATTLDIILASASLSGAGDLSAAGGILLLGSATLTGSGDLSATGERVVLGVATLSGSGDLSAAPVLLVLSTATLSGTGDLSATLERVILGSATLSGAGDLSATTYLIVAAVANLSGTGDLTATGEIGGIVEAEANLSGTGGLSASPYKLIPASASLSGAGDLSATTLVLVLSSTSLSGAGDLSATLERIVLDSATLSGVGDLGAATLVLVLSSATLSGTGDLSADCVVESGGGVVTAEATLTGSGDLSASPYLFIVSDATLSGIGDLSATGVLVFSTSANLSGSGDLSAVPSLVVEGAAFPIEGHGALTATGSVIVMSDAVLSGYGDIYAAPVLVMLAQALLSGVGDLSAMGNIEGWEPDRRVYRPRASYRTSYRRRRTYYKESD